MLVLFVASGMMQHSPPTQFICAVMKSGKICLQEKIIIYERWLCYWYFPLLDLFPRIDSKRTCWLSFKPPCQSWHPYTKIGLVRETYTWTSSSLLIIVIFSCRTKCSQWHAFCTLSMWLCQVRYSFRVMEKSAGINSPNVFIIKGDMGDNGYCIGYEHLLWFGRVGVRMLFAFVSLWRPYVALRMQTFTVRKTLHSHPLLNTLLYYYWTLILDMTILDLIYFWTRPICVTISVGELGGPKTQYGILKCDRLILEGQNL